MAGYHVVHSADWRFTPTAAQVDAIRTLLSNVPGEYETITVDLHEGPQVYGGDFTAHCSSCNASIEDWGDWWEAWEFSGGEPMVRCGNCGGQAPLTALRYDGVAICRFAIHLTEATEETAQAVLAEAGLILGVPLTVTRYAV